MNGDEAADRSEGRGRVPSTAEAIGATCGTPTAQRPACHPVGPDPRREVCGLSPRSRRVPRPDQPAAASHAGRGHSRHQETLGNGPAPCPADAGFRGRGRGVTSLLPPPRPQLSLRGSRGGPASLPPLPRPLKRGALPGSANHHVREGAPEPLGGVRPRRPQERGVQARRHPARRLVPRSVRPSVRPPAHPSIHPSPGRALVLFQY